MDKKLKNTRLIFLTAGEVPSKSNLISSQVLKLARYYYDNSIFKEVEYIGYIPIRSLFKTILFGQRSDFTFIKEMPIASKILYTNFIIGGFFEFMFHSKFAVSDAKKIVKYIDFKSDEAIIFHCRSYYATNIGIEIKKLLPHKNIKILFDMRSLLPPEFYFMMGKKGKLLYATAKEWEYYLLNNANVSLMTTNKGIELLKIENTKVNIDYIPIMGLDSEDIDINEVFQSRWKNKKISYVGSVGAWHPLHMVEKTLKYFEKNISSCEVEIISSYAKLNTDIKRTTLEHGKINDYYINMLGLVIPGRDTDSYFENLQLRKNLFSTKAAEAISVGVPLIVNENIIELAEFVESNKCGIIFRNKPDGLELVNCTIEDINRIEFWKEITTNTYLVSEKFRFEKVATRYLKYYREMV